MRQAKKVGLLLVMAVPLLTIGLTEAAHAYTKSLGPNAPGRVSPDSFGKATANIVCGDRLCSEVNQKTFEDIHFELIDIYPISGERYKVLVKVYSNELTATQNKALDVKSDIADKKIPVPKIFAGSYDYLSTIIAAEDPTTITVTKPDVTKTFEQNFEEPSVEILDVSDISTQSQIYRVVIETSAGTENLANVRVLVQSDSESMYINTSVFAESSNTSHVLIKTNNPDSITAEVVSYKENR